jgi:16S rRNA A1518/A1519 N6-dimethyltransferase RsmA/KsgA/DIM1 with predicted DNA glycosylase/AP lyase activity
MAAVVLCAIGFVCFVFVIAFGAPFLPTLKPQVGKALDMIDLRPGDTLLELGSGDGRVLAAAAERGITAIGYELNPLLVVYSWLRTRKYGKKVQVKWANFWRITLPKTDGIFVFLLQPYMEKLHKKIVQEQAGHKVKLVSFAFTITSQKPARSDSGMFLYEYK